MSRKKVLFWLLRICPFRIYASAEFNRVKRQYEIFPYNDRGPLPSNITAQASLRDLRALFGQQSYLDYINNFIYDGNLLSHQPLRILNAGGGVGRDTLLLAKEMEENGIHGSVTHIDVSQASILRAQEWIGQVSLQRRVIFEQVSIEEFTAREANRSSSYDVIVCLGVLHHLQDPRVALDGLRQILAPEGGMFVMVYGIHGRAGVYEAQAALRYTLPPDELLTDAERLLELKGFLFECSPDDMRTEQCEGNSLPKTNLLSLNAELNPKLGWRDDELFDMLLHSQDRAYSVLDLDELVRSAGLRILSFLGEAKYEPDNTIFRTERAKNTYMAKRLRNRPRLEQFHFTELMTGQPSGHTVFITHALRVPLTYTWPPDARVLPEWRHCMMPVLIDVMNFQQDIVPMLKQGALLRSGGDTYLRKGTYVLRMPPLSFAFWEASKIQNITAEGIIREVQAMSAEWSQEWSVQAVAPLTYEEVSSQFFQWARQMESTLHVLWVHV